MSEPDNDAGRNGGVDVHGDKSADGRLQCENPCAGHDDDEIQSEDHIADFQTVEFFDDRADDIKSSCTGIVPIEKTERRSEQDTS